MWMLTEAPRGSSYYEARSTTGNKVPISDTCETVPIGTAPTRGIEVDMTAKMLDIARPLGAVVLG